MIIAAIFAGLRRPASWHRWSVASRTVAAVAGGYAVTSLATLAPPLALGAVGVSIAPALVGGMMASFFLYAAIIMAVFHARSAARAWRG